MGRDVIGPEPLRVISNTEIRQSVPARKVVGVLKIREDGVR